MDLTLKTEQALKEINAMEHSFPAEVTPGKLKPKEMVFPLSTLLLPK